nr:MAG TPA: hypothetical protein [Caudoviricetes sp.]
MLFLSIKGYFKSFSLSFSTLLSLRLTYLI